VVSHDGHPDVSVVGPEAVASGTLPGAAEIVATALHPLGGRFAEPLPPGVVDYGAEVFAQADAFSGAAVGPDVPAWEDGGTASTHADLLSRAAQAAREVGLPAGGRLLTDGNPATLDGAVTGLLAPLLVDGSVVLVRAPDAARLPALMASERVDVSRWVGSAP